MANVQECIVRIFILTLTWILNSQTPWGGMAIAEFESFTTSGGVHYLLSDFVTNYNSVTAKCSEQNTVPATFVDNAEYQDFADYLRDAGGYDSKQIWITISESGGKFYFSGGEEIDPEHWFTDEPNYTCGSGTCCYRVAKVISSIVDPKHNIADNQCTRSYYVLCKGSVATTYAPVTTTTLATTTVTTVPTTTPSTMPTTPTTITTTPTAIPTTPTTPTTIPTTLTTIPTTLTTLAPSTTTTTTTILPTTPTSPTTTPPPTLTTLRTTVTTSDPTTTSTPSAVSAATSEDEVVALSTGEQMTLLYLGFIVGGSILISCICSCCWLAINRGIRRRRKQHDLEGDEEENGNNVDDSDEDN